MSTGTPLIQRIFGNRIGLARGEKFVAATGMAFVSTLIFALVTLSVLTTRSADEMKTDLLTSNAIQLSTVLASQAEIRINERDLSALRRLLLDAASAGNIEQCSVIVPGVGVLASADSKETTIDTFDDLTAAAAPASARTVDLLEDGRVEINEPLRTAESGTLVLKLVTVPNQAAGFVGSIRLASVAVGVTGLFAMLWIYRRFRSKLGGISAVRDSLIAFGGGERRTPCLVVSESLGVEAAIWNTILNEREAVRQESMNNEIRESILMQTGDGIGVADACNALTQGIMVVDGDLHVLYANGAACSFLGFARDSVVGLNLHTTSIDPVAIEAIEGVASGAAGARGNVEVGDLGKIQDGGTILRFSIAQVPDAEDTRSILMIQDITQQRLSDESRNSLMAQATHELRTPLTNIKLYVEEAIEAGSDDEAIRDTALNVINKEARRLERVISDMMSVSEIEAGSLSIRSGDLRIDQMVDDLVADYQPQAKEKSIALDFDLPPKMPVLQGDRDRIGQALHNLIGNAIKYTPEGGKVRVGFEFDEDDTMRVEVSDTGIGIDPAECSKIFEKFYRADDRRIVDVTGSGLGLALAREIARLHGGDITVDSAIDQGSTFTLTIPGTAATQKKAA
ncbi:MAG: PAS domain S-box protein [Phycisphaerales bacterium]|nr:PAS domain S-box protein [Phycisphaerales bacterium]